MTVVPPEPQPRSPAQPDSPEQALAKRTEQLQAKIRQLAVVAGLGQDALAGAPIPRLLRTVGDIAVRVLGASHVLVLELSPDGSSLIARYGHGWTENLIGAAICPAPAAPLAPILITRRPGPGPDCAWAGLLDAHALRSAVAAPIGDPARPQAVLAAHSAQPGRFSAEDLLFLESLTHILTTALERQRTQERLSLLTRAVESIGEGLVITDARQAAENASPAVNPSGPALACVENEPVIYANPAFLRLTGYSTEEVLGRDCASLVAAANQDEALADIRAAVREKGVFQGEIQCARKDGGLFWNELRVRAIQDAQGEVVNHVLVHQDVSERKHAAASLRAAHDELEERIRERTTALERMNAELTQEIMFREKVEEDLRDRDALLKAVLDSLTAHIAVIDRQGVIIGVNQAWTRYARETRGASGLTLGANYLAERAGALDIAPAKVAELLRGVRAVLEGNLPSFSLEFAAQVQNRSRLFLAQVTPLPTLTGGAVVSRTDITKRMLTEEALKASEQNYRAIFNAVNDAIFVHSQDTLEIMDANEKIQDMYGYAPFEVRTLSFADLSADESPQTLKNARRRFDQAALGRPQIFEWLAKNKQGEPFWVEICLRPTRLGGHAAILAVARDISERKRTERDLHFRMAFEKLITAISVHFINLAPDGVEEAVAGALADVAALLGVEQSFVAFFDRTGQERTDQGQADRDQTAEDQAEGREIVCGGPAPTCWLEAARFTPERLPWIFGRLLARFESLALSSLAELPEEAALDRETLAAIGVRSCAMVPLRFGRELVGVLCFSVGAEEKAWSEEIVSLLKILGQIFVNVMESKRIQEELAQRMQELARSNADLEQFAYVASHDLQEPLRMISSYVQLLSRRYQGRLDADADDFIGFAVDGVRRMQVIIQDLLAYSRVGTRGKPFQAVPAERPLREALANLRAAVEESQAEITLGRLPEIMADPSQITQVFQNLIGNAIKFHRPGQPPRVRVEAVSEDGFWRFTVQDQGIGLDPQYAERIFVLFQRLHAPDEYPGTGIGLAICKKIVERHGGRIWVESTPGLGAAFHFTLPGARRS